MLQAEVFFAMIRCFRLLLNQASKFRNLNRVKDLVYKSTKSIAALQASYAELALCHSLQNARLLAARCSMEFFAIALKLTADQKGMIFVDNIQELSKKAFIVKTKEIKKDSLTDQQRNELNVIVKQFAEIEAREDRRLVFQVMTKQEMEDLVVIATHAPMDTSLPLANVAGPCSSPSASSAKSLSVDLSTGCSMELPKPLNLLQRCNLFDLLVIHSEQLPFESRLCNLLPLLN